MYRFYEINDGKKVYLCADTTMTVYKTETGIFTQFDWDDWAQWTGLEREELSEAEKMTRDGQPMLPRMSLLFNTME